MKRSTIYIIGVMLIASANLKAQQQKNDTVMSRTVVVEQEYTPDILDAQKINVMPQVEPLTSSDKKIQYATSPLSIRQIPTSLMPVYAGEEIQTAAWPGYVRLGAGLPGNIDLLTNYLYNISEKDQLNAFLLFNGNSGDRKSNNGEKWHARYYQTRAGVDFTHDFTSLKLDLGAHLGISNFNRGYEMGNQNFTSGDIHVGLTSAQIDQAITYQAETNLMYYKRKAGPSSHTEYAIKTKGYVLAPFAENQSVGIGFRLDNFFYKSEKDIYKYKNNSNLAMNPYYLYENDTWKLRLGANVNYAFGLESKFNMAPDIDAQYHFSEKNLFYARATGGNISNDFRRFEQLTPYADLPSQQVIGTFEQVNIAVGLKGNPFEGLWYNIFGGYQDLKRDIAPLLRNNYYSNGVSYTVNQDNATVIPTILAQANTHNLYIGAEANYDYKSIFNISVSATYRGWGISDDELKELLTYKPAFIAEMDLTYRPINQMRLNMGYQYVGRKGGDLLKPKAINNLYFGGSYQLKDNFSVYAQINNLLNQKYHYFAGIPEQGINFVGGITLGF